MPDFCLPGHPLIKCRRVWDRKPLQKLTPPELGGLLESREDCLGCLGGLPRTCGGLERLQVEVQLLWGPEVEAQSFALDQMRGAAVVAQGGAQAGEGVTQRCPTVRRVAFRPQQGGEHVSTVHAALDEEVRQQRYGLAGWKRQRLPRVPYVRRAEQGHTDLAHSLRLSSC